MRKLWGGAFAEGTDSLAERFGQSIGSDLRFWREDVLASIAHARMLGSTGILSEQESALLVRGLEQILEEGATKLPLDVEDIHTAVESRLGEIVGSVAGKLHTARSRNDQVATSARMHARLRVEAVQKAVKGLQSALVQTASLHRKTLMPGVTHQQHAQPISLGFHLLAHFFAFQRHGRRLEWVHEMLGGCPLGSAALAGTSFPVDRSQTAQELGFTGPLPNALDATSDRSWVLDGLHACAMTMIDLSRLSQELVNWAGPEYRFVELSDSLTTGSSIMPQKRNPDMAELIRGRTGRAIGHWTALACTMKGLVLGYNRDTQDDKPALFESLDLVEDALRLMERMVATATWNKKRMARSLKGDFSTATDLADYLARTGMPFRQAHEVVGKLVQACSRDGIGLEGLTAEHLHRWAPEVPAEALHVLSPSGSLASKESFGGTGPESVRKQVELARRLLARKGFAYSPR